MDVFFACFSKEFTDCVFPGDFLTVLKIKSGYLIQKSIQVRKLRELQIRMSLRL